MARKPRILYPGALHHVIVRGNHKEEIFLYDRDRKKFISLLEEYHERYLFKCYAYSLMPNHIHLLIEEGDIPLPKVMQGINQSYTKYFNKRYEKVGHLFQGRYKAILVDKQKYLLVLVRYIHLNSVKALLVKKPEDYEWSSHYLYLSSEKESFIERDYVLSLFGNTRKEAVKRYIEFINEGIGEKTPGFDSGNFIADDEFIEKIIRKHGHLHKKKSRISLDEITSIVIESFALDRQHLFSKSRQRRVSFARGVIGYLAREMADIPTKQIGGYFNRDPSALTNSIRRVMSKMREEPEMIDRIKQLKIKIKKGTRNNSIIKA